MTDITTIGAILSSLKTATDIAKALRESGISLERAELKLKLADLVTALAEAKIELAGIQETLAIKDKHIADLEAAFLIKDHLIREYDAYYVVNGNNKPEGVPFCLRCWENDHKQRQLVQDTKDRSTNICTTCGHRYGGYSTRTIPPEAKR